MGSYKDGDVVIIFNKHRYQVAMVIGKVYNNKKTLYDVLLENRSVIAAIPAGETSKQAYIDINLTKWLIDSKKIHTTIPDYKLMVDNSMLPAYREESAGPRSF